MNPWTPFPETTVPTPLTIPLWAMGIAIATVAIIVIGIVVLHKRKPHK
jgi:hypothetical protein